MFGLKRKDATDNNGRHNGHNRDGNHYLVDLIQVVKTYESAAGKFTALKSVDLKLDSGEFLSIIGKSGSGKSTLINMVTGIDRPTSGQVIVNGATIHSLNEEQIALWRGRSVGVIFQFFQLLPALTAVENVILPMDYWGHYPAAGRPERAMSLLELVEMADYAHKLPAQLSGGQQQSVAIARALANDPPVLAADEPTGNLDTRTAEQVMRLFEGLVERGKTILMVTHDRDLAERALRTVVIADGEIVDEIVRR
ncbi:MAG: ABC transporter ATP-binding protein [Anaerolineales bacterium]|nr:ABC transporter ATP-binding protein [Anaerolineales bacterium]